jgi:heme/copper-type cytochrome/quinol oxidase subunit 2
VDTLYFFVTAVTAFFALLVVICMVVFAIKYRDRAGDRVGAPMTGSIPLELGWSIVPFFTSVAIFGWATVVFFDRVRAPDQTLEANRPASDGRGGSSTTTDRARSTSWTCGSDGPST